MYEMVYLELGGASVSLWTVLMTALALAAAAGAVLWGKKQGVKPAAMGLYAALSAVLGLLIGRGIYCAVCWYDVFLDAMGEFVGIAPFFDLSVGSVNVMGLVAGLLLAAPIAAMLTKEKTARLLDAAVMPALALYTCARLIEPLNGQGYGDLMGYEVCVCWIEAALTAVVLVLAPMLRRKSRLPGTLAQYVLTIWCLSQILPESLRCDEALYVFIFARVTHLGLAVTVGVTLIRLLVQGAKHGLDRKSILLDAIGLAAGIGLCIATIFALDKTNLPKLLVYAAMLLSLGELGFVICRRIHKEDIR